MPTTDTGPAGNPSLPSQAAVRDPLRVAGRLVLGPGEQFAGSGQVKDSDGAVVVAAAVQTPDGRQVHIGVVYDENRKDWRGAHAPAQETAIDDEEGEEYTVDTGADATAVLNAEDAARLGEVAEEVISRATAADKEFRQLGKDFDRLTQRSTELEAQRFADPAQVEQWLRLDGTEAQQVKYQGRRREFMDSCAARLSPADRAAYDVLQQQIDAAGRDMWDLDNPEPAAALCGLSVEEFQEMQDLRGIDWRQRSQEQQSRLDQLEDERPPLLEQQAALICGLSVDEFREMRRLERLRGRRGPDEQARLTELDNSPRGATAATPGRTVRMRGSYLSYQNAHHTVKSDLAHTRRDQAALEAVARPLDAVTAAERQRVQAELDTVSNRYEELNGGVSASAEIPARNGGALVLEAIQQEDGGVHYRLDRRPTDADEDWSPGDAGDPYSSTASGLRKVAKMVASLAQ